MYLLLKVVHVIGVIVFLGNIATGLFWHSHAWRTGDPRLLAHTVSGIIRSDRVFTTPGVLVLFAAGIATAVVGRIPMSTGWIAWTLILLVGAGAIFGLRVAPLQRQMLAVAREGEGGGQFDRTRYAQLARQWKLWGGIALGLPLVGVALMVFKPPI